MAITQEQYDQLYTYTLRVELTNGKVLFYMLDGENRKYLLTKLGNHSEGDEESKNIEFLYFETTGERQVIINNKDILRLSFLVDIYQNKEEENEYFDNFGVVEKDTALVEKETASGETRLYVMDEIYLPDAMAYHRGKPSDNSYYSNPMQYTSLEDGCLGSFFVELDGIIPLRQFIHLIDEDGEASFVSLQQVIVMEFSKDLMYDVDRDSGSEDDGEDDEEEDNGDWDGPFDGPLSPAPGPGKPESVDELIKNEELPF